MTGWLVDGIWAIFSLVGMALRSVFQAVLSIVEYALVQVMEGVGGWIEGPVGEGSVINAVPLLDSVSGCVAVLDYVVNWSSVQSALGMYFTALMFAVLMRFVLLVIRMFWGSN